MKNNPIIIIGAGRSGTNILRDTICSIEGYETWPCDEINYIWRHGNIGNENDRFTENEATPKITNFIIKQFEKFEKDFSAEYVVEKTCANSLKVPFINKIFPQAKYIFIIRDGRDVASSAKQRWTASLELDYIFQKAKYVPILDLPYYGIRYFVNRIKKIFSKEKRLAFWGPIYPGMFKDLKNDSLIEVCAKQWKNSVEIAVEDLSKLKGQVHYVKYEEFVNNPIDSVKEIFSFLGKTEIDEKVIKEAVKDVNPRSINNYKKYIKGEELEKLNAIVEPVMSKIYQNI